MALFTFKRKTWMGKIALLLFPVFFLAPIYLAHSVWAKSVCSHLSEEFPAQTWLPKAPVVQGSGLWGPSFYPMDPPAPLVSLRIRVPALGSLGQELEYRICVENKADADAHHVLVRNPLPANTRFVSANPKPSALSPELQWNLGTLGPGGCVEIVLILAP